MFNGQGNDLAAYETSPPFRKQIVVHHNDDAHPDGLDINGQICFDPKHPRRFVAGEDTHQDTTGEPGWGIFELSGESVGDLSARQIGKLVPTYQTSNSNPENYGCAFLDDGRILTTDVGNQAEGDGDGQLIVWFGPFDSRDGAVLQDRRHAADRAGHARTGRQRASSRRPVRPAPASGEYDTRAFPTSDTAAGGCDTTDATGAPMAGGIVPTQFIEPAVNEPARDPERDRPGSRRSALRVECVQRRHRRVRRERHVRARHPEAAGGRIARRATVLDGDARSASTSGPTVRCSTPTSGSP